MENNNEAVKSEELNQDEDRQIIENEKESKEDEIETEFNLESNVEEQDEEKNEVEESIEERLKKAEEEKKNLQIALKKERQKKKEPEEDVRAIVKEVITSSKREENETLARDEFLREFPEYTKSSNWRMLVNNFSSKGGSSKEEILQDFKRADALVRLEKGELTPEYQEKYMRSRAEAQISSLNTISSSSSSKSYSPPEFSNEDLQIMKQFNIPEDSMRKYKEAKESGQIL